MSEKFVKHEVDLANLPPLTWKRKAELEALTTRPDREIDYCDIHPLFWGVLEERGAWPFPAKTGSTPLILSFSPREKGRLNKAWSLQPRSLSQWERERG